MVLIVLSFLVGSLFHRYLSKPKTPLGPKKMAQFREVSGIERCCMYSEYREQDPCSLVRVPAYRLFGHVD